MEVSLEPTGDRVGGTVDSHGNYRGKPSREYLIEANNNEESRRVQQNARGVDERIISEFRGIY